MLISIALLALSTNSSHAQIAVNEGDYIITSRQYGFIYAVDPETGLIRSVISGRDYRFGVAEPDLLTPPVLPIVGQGPTLESFHTTLAILPGMPLLARVGVSNPLGGPPREFTIVEIDTVTGDRSGVPETIDGGYWTDAGDLAIEGPDSLLVTSDHFNENIRGGSLLRYIPSTRTFSIISSHRAIGGKRIVEGDGPVIEKMRALAIIDENTAVVTEFRTLGIDGDNNVALYSIDLHTGERRVISHLSVGRPLRDVFVNGQIVESGRELSRGSGPVFNFQVRSLLVMDGFIFAGGTIFTATDGFEGGILKIDPVTGDRELIVGYAFADDGTGATVLSAPASLPPGANFDGIAGLVETQDGNIAFTTVFGQGSNDSIFEYNLESEQLRIVSDFSTQLDPLLAAPPYSFTDLEISDRTISFCPGDCEQSVFYIPSFSLVDPTPQAGQSFGASLAVSEGRAVIGVPLYDDVTNGVDSGRVRLFDTETGVVLQTLEDPTPSHEDQFGAAVAIEGDACTGG